MIAYLSSPLLLELGTNFPQSQPLVKDCQFGVSPVNYSDSDQIRHFVPRFPIWIYSGEGHDYYGLPIHGNTGSKIGIDAGGPVVTPDTRGFTPDPVREQSCIDLLQRVLPSVSYKSCDMRKMSFAYVKTKAQISLSAPLFSLLR